MARQTASQPFGALSLNRGDGGKRVDELALALGLRDGARFNNVLHGQKSKFNRLGDRLSRRNGVQLESS
jgi:hypothetical protein